MKTVKIEVIRFKESGKFYSIEEIEVPKELTIDEKRDYVEKEIIKNYGNANTYHWVVIDDVLGYPLMIPIGNIARNPFRAK